MNLTIDRIEKLGLLRGCKGHAPCVVLGHEFEDGLVYGCTPCWLATVEAVVQYCAYLHESVNPASDAERLDKSPGAGAMGAVIEYRELIRARFGLKP